MSITASIRKRPWLLLGMIIIALLAFLINPESMDKMFGQNPNILGKVMVKKSLVMNLMTN